MGNFAVKTLAFPLIQEIGNAIFAKMGVNQDGKVDNPAAGALEMPQLLKDLLAKLRSESTKPEEAREAKVNLMRITIFIVDKLKILTPTDYLMTIWIPIVD